MSSSRVPALLFVACACSPSSSDDPSATAATAESGTTTSESGTSTGTTTSDPDTTTSGTSSGAPEGSSSDESSSGGTTLPPWEWDLPPGFPEPVVPDDNPMSVEKVELGRHLFYDTRMSGHGEFACATCHLQALAFTDGRTTAIGETGQLHRRNSMSLVNAAYDTTLTWAHPMMFELEQQAIVPMFGNDPIELGLDSEDELLAALAVEPSYATMFADAFPEDPEPSVAHVVYALSAFQRTIISGDSPFDRWFAGDETAISASAQRGYELFNGHPFECFHCHVGFNLSDAVYFDPTEARAPKFHNTGLYNTDGAGAYPDEDQGLFELTLEPGDVGKFRVPTLRNIAVTGPYMHDGSIATLDEVLDHYAAGGRTIAEGPHAGVGSESPLKDPLITGFAITPDERADLLAFLESLTDEGLLADPALADPWPR